MKRVKSGCILQTLVFSQKPEYNFDKERQLKYNHQELEKYKKDLENHKIRYQILSVEEQQDCSIVVHVRKQLNEKTDVGEYFN